MTKSGVSGSKSSKMGVQKPKDAALSSKGAKKGQKGVKIEGNHSWGSKSVKNDPKMAQK